uniref:Uncharacterized protein n=1 Tax=Cucumis melo TaxID=3656 RepID=A0A9I9CCN5_CUCME
MRPSLPFLSQRPKPLHCVELSKTPSTKTPLLKNAVDPRLLCRIMPKNSKNHDPSTEELKERRRPTTPGPKNVEERLCQRTPPPNLLILHNHVCRHNSI